MVLCGLWHKYSCMNLRTCSFWVAFGISFVLYFLSNNLRHVVLVNITWLLHYAWIISNIWMLPIWFPSYTLLQSCNLLVGHSSHMLHHLGPPLLNKKIHFTNHNWGGGSEMPFFKGWLSSIHFETLNIPNVIICNPKFL